MQTRGYQGLHETAGISLAVGQDRVGKGDALPVVRDYWLTPNPGWNAFPTRSKILAVLLMLFLGITQAHTQQGASPFIGEWKGQIEGIGEARLVIAAVKSNGQIEGQMAFSLKSFVSTFGDKADSAKNTSLGIVSDSTLSIESALGGKYELARTGNQLTGIYTRGTTFRGSASFTKM